VQKLGIVDASFLYFERDGALMNIASVQRFVKPREDLDMPEFHGQLKRYLAARVHGVDFMTRRLQWTPFDLDQPAWATDPSFDIARHVLRTRLSPPGSDRQLEALIARLHERPLDRGRPLWEMHLIDGLQDGTFALYSKYHHAAVDGVAAQQIMNVLYGDTPDRNPLPAPATQTDAVSRGQLLFDALLNLAMQPVEQFAAMSERLASLARVNARLRDGTAGAASLRAPHTPFNVRVSDYRAFASASLPLAEMRALGKRVGASANDVLLAVCAEGLRRYLQRSSQLPDAPLIAGVPVSVRAASDHSFRNKVSMLRASLETQIDDPLDRLKAIAESTRAGKALLADARGLLPDDVHIPGLASFLQYANRVAGRLPWSEMVEPACNVLISNVPGPRKTKYLLGAEMLSHHPVSIAADGSALNITVQSYCGRLDLGITACLEAVPDVEDMRDDILAGWTALNKRLRSGPGSLAA